MAQSLGRGQIFLTKCLEVYERDEPSCQQLLDEGEPSSTKRRRKRGGGTMPGRAPAFLTMPTSTPTTGCPHNAKFPSFWQDLDVMVVFDMG